MGPIRTMVGVALLVLGTAAEAQRPSPISIAVTPYFGLVSPGRELLLRPGLDPLRDPESQALLGVVGGRLAVGLSEKLGVEADIGLGVSGGETEYLAPHGGNPALEQIEVESLVDRCAGGVHQFCRRGGRAGVVGRVMVERAKIQVND